MSDPSRPAARILLADDNPKNIRLLEMTLKQDGYQLLVAADGEEALKIFIREKPDLVILDALMPKMDGLAVCQKIREHVRERRVPIILSSAFYQGHAYESEKGKMGVDVILPKPVKPAELLQTVRDLLAANPAQEGES